MVLVDRASGTRRTVSEGWSSLAGLSWKSGGELWFSGARTGGNMAIHSLQLDAPGARVRLGPGQGDPAPLTSEGLAGAGHLNADASAFAFVAPDGRLLTVELDSGRLAAIPGTFTDRQVCEWRSGLFVRTLSVPLQISRIDPATGASRPYKTVSPPPIGRKGVDAFSMSSTVGAHAYSYGEEVSKLCLMSASATAGG